MARSWLIALCAVQGILLGTALGVLIADGRYVEATSCVAFWAVVLAIARAGVPGPHRTMLVALAGSAFALRACAAVILHVGSLAVGMDGFITGDDREYYLVSRAFVLWLQGRPEPPYVPPYWAGELYLFGTWIYVESIFFLAVGALPLVPIFLNGALGASTSVMAWHIGTRLFGARSGSLAAVAVAVWPSLVLWSALNLKDALALALIVVFMTALLRLWSTAALRGLIAPGLVLVLMQSLRGYIFTGLAVLLPVGAWLVTGATRRASVRLVLASVVVGGGALALDQAGIGLGSRLLQESLMYREGMALGARTAIAPAPVEVQTGSTFVVPVRDVPPSELPRVVHVAPQSRIVVGTPPQVTQAGVVHVRPGDIVVVGGPQTTPGPAEGRMSLQGDQIDLVQRRDQSAEELALRTIAYLPQGLLYSLFAPWPWLGDRRQDLLTIPEMIVWYVCLAAAAHTAWTHRSDRRLYVPALFAAGTLLVFALVEGNWGTLFRHRSMVIPLVVVLAAPTLLAAVGRRWAGFGLAAAKRERPGTELSAP
jgi:hypothetical protein